MLVDTESSYTKFQARLIAQVVLLFLMQRDCNTQKWPGDRLQGEPGGTLKCRCRDTLLYTGWPTTLWRVVPLWGHWGGSGLMTGVAKARVPTGGRLTTPNWGLVAPFRSSSSSRTPASHPSPQSLLSTGSGAERVTLLEDLRRKSV